jgi:hypothetical protein
MPDLLSIKFEEWKERGQAVKTWGVRATAHRVWTLAAFAAKRRVKS